MINTGWLVYSRGDARRNAAYIVWMQQEAERLGWKMELVLRDELRVGVQKGQLVLHVTGGLPLDSQRELNSNQHPDFVILRIVDPVLSTQLEHLNIPVFNSAHVSSICNNKALTYQYLQQFDIPMLDSEFCNTEDLREALVSGSEVSPSMQSSFVIKAVAGRGGQDVALIEGREQLRMFIQSHPHTDVVLQRLGPVPGKDIRVFVVGNEIVAAVLRSSASADFRANYSLGGKAEIYSLSESETALVRRIIACFEFGMAGIDFLLDGVGGLLFNEIEDVVGSRTLSKVAPETNLVRRYLEYIGKKLS